MCKPNHEKFRNFILRIFLETRTTFSLFFKLNNSALVHEIFGRLFSIHRVKSIQKSLNYSSYLDSIVFNRCRSARARVSIFDEFRSVFRGNFEKSEKFRNGERRKFRNFIFFFGLHAYLIEGKMKQNFWSKKRDASVFFFSLVYSSSAKKPLNPLERIPLAYKNRHTRNIVEERVKRSLLVDRVFSLW